MKHVNLTITGRVQGVWYRGSTQKKARELGLNGFVKNQADGSVYAEAEGPEENINRLISWCRRGPELAVVQNVEVREGEWQGFEDFIVLR